MADGWWRIKVEPNVVSFKLSNAFASTSHPLSQNFRFCVVLT